MKALVLTAAVLAVTLPSAEAGTYIIDPTQSQVKAYVPVWERVLSGFTMTQDPDTGSFEFVETYNWQLDWTLQTYGLSGTFELEREAHAWDPERARLHVSRATVVTDAPAHAQFSLPDRFAQQGTSLYFDGGPCFDTDFYDSPSWTTSCSGWTMGPTRSDEGTLQDGTLTVQGGKQSWLIWSGWAPDSPEPPVDVDYTPVLGLFEYRMVAVSAVPEPAAAGLMLAGLALLAFRRHKAQA